MGIVKELIKSAIKTVEKPFAKAGVKVAEETVENAEKSISKALANGAMKEGRYASKANYAKWIESMGGKAPQVESSFKNWSTGTSVLKSTERSTVSSTKATGKTITESTTAVAKTTKEAAEETVKKPSIINKENLQKAAKLGWNEGGKIVSKTAGWAGQYANYTAKHPVASLILSSVAYHQVTGRNLLPDVMKSLGGESADKKGLVGVVGDMALGKKTDSQGQELGVLPNIADIFFGNGSYENIKKGVDSITNEAEGVYKGVKGGVTSVIDEGSNLYHAGKEQVGRYFSGNGMVANGHGGYYDPTTSQYPSTAQMMGPAHASLHPQGGLTGTMMNGVNTVANEITGGNVSKMNLAALALSSYMMFGPFGWLGKMVSLMLGGMTMRNINQRQSEGYAMQHMPRYGMEPSLLMSPNRQQPEVSLSEEPVIRRSRGI